MSQSYETKNLFDLGRGWTFVPIRVDSRDTEIGQMVILGG